MIIVGLLSFHFLSQQSFDMESLLSVLGLVPCTPAVHRLISASFPLGGGGAFFSESRQDFSISLAEMGSTTIAVSETSWTED